MHQHETTNHMVY